MEDDAAADLMAAHSGVNGDRALRQALQRRVESGGAQLFDTAWIALDGGEEALKQRPKAVSGKR